MAVTQLPGKQIGPLDLTTEVTGVLPTANGGTAVSASGAAGNTLVSNGSVWTSAPPSTRINFTASSATPAINVDTTDQFNITALAAAITSMTSGLSGTPLDGQKLMIRIKDNGTARAITWGASFASTGIATLLATTVVNKTHYVGLIYSLVTSTWDCVACDPVGR